MKTYQFIYKREDEEGNTISGTVEKHVTSERIREIFPEIHTNLFKNFNITKLVIECEREGTGSSFIFQEEVYSNG